MERKIKVIYIGKILLYIIYKRYFVNNMKRLVTYYDYIDCAEYLFKRAFCLFTPNQEMLEMSSD